MVLEFVVQSYVDIHELGHLVMYFCLHITRTKVLSKVINGVILTRPCCGCPILCVRQVYHVTERREPSLFLSPAHLNGPGGSAWRMPSAFQREQSFFTDHSDERCSETEAARFVCDASLYVCVVIVLSAGIIAKTKCLWGWKGGSSRGSLPGQVREQVHSCCVRCNHLALILPVLVYRDRVADLNLYYQW